MKKQNLISMFWALGILVAEQLCIADVVEHGKNDSQEEPVVCILYCQEGKNPKQKRTFGQESLCVFKLSSYILCDKGFKFAHAARAIENSEYKPLYLKTYLYKREIDAKSNALILKFEIVYNNTCYQIPEITWNQKDDFILWSGGNCVVYLSKSNRFNLLNVSK